MKMPSHKMTKLFRGEETVVAECFPIEKASGSKTCRYCQERHSDWWRMNSEEYGRRMFLCRKCEHVSPSAPRTSDEMDAARNGGSGS
jgi:hypothetical protein